jgi:hypothetical protein
MHCEACACATAVIRCRRTRSLAGGCVIQQAFLPPLGPCSESSGNLAPCLENLASGDGWIVVGSVRPPPSPPTHARRCALHQPLITLASCQTHLVSIAMIRIPPHKH